MLRTYGLVACGGVALLSILTLANHWPNVVSMVPTVGFAALLIVPMVLLSRSRAAHQHQVRLMREAALGGAWVQARVLQVQGSYFGRARGRWTFQRTHLRLGFTDPKTGQPREVRSDLYMHPEEKLVSGQVIWVRCHPSFPEPVFVPVQG